MRVTAKSKNGEFRAQVIAGTRAILIALDCAESRRGNLQGFSFYRVRKGTDQPGKWLRSQKVFKSLVENPKGKTFTSEKHPIQSFLWSDYTADPDVTYVFTVQPRYGNPAQLGTDPDDEITISVKTEPENDPSGHGVWFNRGAIAGQQFAREFGDVKPTSQQLEDLTQPITRWLSRGLVEACLAFIDEVPANEAIRACFYEFTYKPVQSALKAAINRGVDVKICFHETASNAKAIKESGLKATMKGRKVLYPRTVPTIPHNKFMVRLDADGAPNSIWTGSTNITASGFLGQSNVGHRINGDSILAQSYLAYWDAISEDPQNTIARKAVAKISPHPAEIVAAGSPTTVFSPRFSANMLQWYANRMLDAQQSVMFTAAFGVNEKFVLPLAQDRDFLRFVLMEKKPPKEQDDRLRADRDLVIAYGAALGKTVFFKDGERVVVDIPKFGLDKWFEEEELFRKEGNIFYVHTKILLVDPLSDDPLICTGSANFSDNSLKNNDENMLLIRGSKRVADIYVTEFDRIFRHFYFRDVANEIEMKGGDAQGAFLDEKFIWTDSYFEPDRFKTHRREMFFMSRKKTWVKGSGARDQRETALGADAPKQPTSKAASKAAPAKKLTTKKTTSKTSVARKAAAKKSPAKKVPAKKASESNTAAKKVLTKTVVAKKAAAKKGIAKKAAVKKALTKMAR